jgi:hypothetical protein
MNRPWRPQNHPHLGDTRSRGADKIKDTRDRAKLVEARCDSHGAHDLKNWLDGVGVNGWCSTDRSEALAIIKRKLGQQAWRDALDVVVLF